MQEYWSFIRIIKKDNLSKNKKQKGFKQNQQNLENIVVKHHSKET